MKRRNNIIFLLGNGFDLSNDLKTSYRDFILYYLKESIISAYKNESQIFSDDCIDLKVKWYPEMKKDIYINYFNQKVLSNSINELVGWPHEKFNSPLIGEFFIIPKGDFMKDILTNCLNSDWNGIEDAIYRVIKQSYLNVKSDIDLIEINPKNSNLFKEANKVIENLNSSVECLKKNLIKYLAPLNNTDTYNSRFFDKTFIWGPVIQKQVIEPISYVNDRDVLFLNFNYTDYYVKMIEDFESENKDFYTSYDHINIHGSINDSLENVVFGIGDEQNEFYHKIESFFGDSWLKNMKSFHYFRQENYQKLLGFISKGNYEVYVLGHSCSITDRTLLNMLFENDYCVKINVYHHNGIASYMKTAYNISRNFNNKVKLRKVLMPYNSYLTTGPI